ncbi:cupin domain-containing protein [Nevskia ramosa]|uniref:cupin domain-containing protein n=1 Tax=Nevskia ramosa TaxID=64002 RepID=UPI0023551732
MSEESGTALITRLGLERHPEGGWFKRIHTSDAVVETAQGSRALVTSIHYLLTVDEPRGRLHRNRSDILHYLQGGGPVEYLLLEDSGELRRVVLGSAPGQVLFLHVPGGVWKASQLIDGTSHALVSEAVVPGFDYADHVFADQRLFDDHPEHRALLSPFVRP